MLVKNERAINLSLLVTVSSSVMILSCILGLVDSRLFLPIGIDGGLLYPFGHVLSHQTSCNPIGILAPVWNYYTMKWCMRDSCKKKV